MKKVGHNRLLFILIIPIYCFLIIVPLKAQNIQLSIISKPIQSDIFIPNWEENRDLFGVLAAGIEIKTELLGLNFKSDKNIVSTFKKDYGYLVLVSVNASYLEINGEFVIPEKYVFKNLGIELQSGKSWTLHIEDLLASKNNHDEEETKSGFNSYLKINTNLDSLQFTLERGKTKIKNWIGEDFFQLEPGFYEIYAEGINRKTYNQRISIKSNDTLALTVNPEKYLLDVSKGTGKLKIYSKKYSETEFTIRHQGNLVAKWVDKENQVSLPVGLYNIKVKSPSYLTFNVNVYLNEGENRSIQVPSIQNFDDSDNGSLVWLNPYSTNVRTNSNHFKVLACLVSEEFNGKQVKLDINGDEKIINFDRPMGIEKCNYIIEEELELLVGDNKVYLKSERKPIGNKLNIFRTN
jgi:hypothetical protein